MSDLQARIEALWADRTPITEGDGEARAAVTEAIGLLDAGEARVAEVNGDGEVVVNQWLKQAILLLFSMAEMETMELG
ncbi:MAG: 2,3,4,5-tetrahydropyridine-2,6-dicarboxylate N-succinyltransferase, partial [Acidimicrobiia bacterium]|nr:2,3,4,5-tetrahydropyridine-2,6-dicarboxylate N-succinyltransferase [Acidimicrobiia bacterium]